MVQLPVNGYLYTAYLTTAGIVSMRLIYSVVLYLLTPLALLRLLWRSRLIPAYRQRWPERLGWVPRLNGQPRIWLHAVSVGEIIAAAPLVQMLQARHPDYALLVTTTTPTGSAQVDRLFADQVAHCYLPYDLPDAVARFLDRVRPTVAVIMETELWPNLYRQLHHRRVPLILANARLSLRSAQGYLRLAPLTRATLACVSRAAVQGQADAERLLVLGLPEARIRVTGNIKFDVRVPEALPAAGQVLRTEWGQERPIWVAASTHQGEEVLMLRAHHELLARFPSALLVLVPRHPERFAKVAALCMASGLETVRRSRGDAIRADVEVLLADTMGELMLFYSAADVAMIAGSLVPEVGGHNPLEAAALQRPILTGPHWHHFAEVYPPLFQAGAAEEVADAKALTAALQRLFAEPATRRMRGAAAIEVVLQGRGALDRIAAMVAVELEKDQAQTRDQGADQGTGNDIARIVQP